MIDAASRPARRRPRIIAVVGATATGKSALGLSLAETLEGEIISCDSTAVYRGFDIGTDKVPVGERRGIAHHLVDIVEPSEQYTAARYTCDAVAAIQRVIGLGRTPIIVGGTGLYYRALTRGLFDGPGRDEALRARLTRRAQLHGAGWLHRMVTRVDRPSAFRIHPNDDKRLIRALEVFFLTGHTLTDHFADTRSPLAGYDLVTVGIRIPRDEIVKRVTHRVHEQFARGLLSEVEGLLGRGVPPDAPPFGGLVYRQVMEYRRGVRDETTTRALIVQENRRYAKRQLIWFLKEPNLHWLEIPGEHPDAMRHVRPVLQRDVSTYTQ